MKIGITYDLKVAGLVRPDLPDDFQEEFDSPTTVEAIAAVLRGLGHEVVLLGDGREMLERLLAKPPDFVFNFAEGLGVSRSREARVPAVLEMLDIPYTGSDPLTLAVTLDKDCAKRLVASAGVVVPWGVAIPPYADPRTCLPETFPLPVIVKPAWEGSSKGIRGGCVVDHLSEVIQGIEAIRHDHRQPVLVEQFIAGDELTVGMIGNAAPRVIGVMRVLPRRATQRFVYSLEIKRDWQRLVRYECPAQLAPLVLQRIEQAALQAYQVLGCRDIARVDFRLSADGTPYFLEVNPLPGLNPESSDLVILARASNMQFPQLIEAILQAALERHSLPLQPR